MIDEEENMISDAVQMATDAVQMATKEEIPALVDLRLAYLEADHGEQSEELIRAARRDLPEYFANHLDKDLFGYVIRQDGQIAACAFLVVVEKMISPDFITGKSGFVMNVYTKPEYRRRGFAKRIMEHLLNEAVQKNLSYVELDATDAGYPVYQSVGFKDLVTKYHVMKWINQHPQI